jgi:pimeloyl-ACP methyl ester carboxylesterase
MVRKRRRSDGFQSLTAEKLVADLRTAERGLRSNAPVAVSDNRAETAGVEIFWREAPSPEGRAPILYVHGSPGNSDDWLPFLERTGGIAPDLPGFGRSGKPAHFDYSIEGYANALEAFLAEREIDRYALVVHDWGAAALALAQRAPERVERLVIMDAVPLVSGYRWHRLARIWRAPLAGELFMGLSSRWAFKRLAREGLAQPPSDELIDSVWDHFDHGTQRAILKLYRSAPPSLLERAGDRLGELRSPALVLWGEDDPYLGVEFAPRFADALGGDTRVEVLAGVRHWPWVDDPGVIDTVADFLLS